MSVTPIFQAAADAVYSLLGEEYVYEKPGQLDQGVLVIPEEVTSDGFLNGHSVRSDVGIFSVRASEVPNPEKGDKLTRALDCKVFMIEGVPELDSRGIAWSIDARPVA